MIQNLKKYYNIDDHFDLLKFIKKNVTNTTHQPVIKYIISNVIKRLQKLIDWTLNKYKTATNTQNMNERVIIDTIIEELDKKREVVINKKQKTLLKDEVLEYGEEDTIDYVLFIIREGTGKLY